MINVHLISINLKKLLAKNLVFNFSLYKINHCVYVSVYVCIQSQNIVHNNNRKGQAVSVKSMLVT